MLKLQPYRDNLEQLQPLEYERGRPAPAPAPVAPAPLPKSEKEVSIFKDVLSKFSPVQANNLFQTTSSQPTVQATGTGIGGILYDLGNQAAGGISAGLSNVKLPTVNTSNEISLSPPVLIFGAVLAYVLLSKK